MGATLKILEVLYQIQATDEQTSDILNTANHVERNLKEAHRLLRMKATLIGREDMEWIKSTLQDTREALQSISKLIEPARVEKMTRNEIGVTIKTFWAFKYNPQARDKQAKLNICHQTLMAVISHLHSTNLPTVPEFSYTKSLPLPPPYDQNMDKLWAWRDHRNSRKKSTMSLRNGFQSGPVALATTQPQVFEGLPQNIHSYSTTTNYMMNSRQSDLAQDVRTYNTSYHPNHRDTSPKPALSHNQTLGLSPHQIAPTAPGSRNGWTHRSQTNITSSKSEVRLPCANTTSPDAFHAPDGPSPAAENFTPPVYEMSAAQTSPPERLLPSHLVTHELAATPRKPIDHSMIILSSDSLTGNDDCNDKNPLHQHFPAPTTRSMLISPSWSSLVSADEPHHPSTTLGNDFAENPDFSLHPRNVLANRWELEAEAVQGGAALADAVRRENPSMDRMWASSDGSWSISNPDLTRSRPGVGDRVRRTENRNTAAGGTGYRGSWLAYQSSLRNSRHGREGTGGI